MFGGEREDSVSRRGGKDQSHLHILRRAYEMIERGCLKSHPGSKFRNREYGRSFFVKFGVIVSSFIKAELCQTVFQNSIRQRLTQSSLITPHALGFIPVAIESPRVGACWSSQGGTREC